VRIQATDTAARPLQATAPQKLPTADAAQAVAGAFSGAHAPTRAADDAADFAGLLRNALTRVNAAQQQADVAVERVATGDAEDMHEAVMALEKADIALRLTAQVTQRAVEAYKEISRMQV